MDKKKAMIFAVLLAVVGVILIQMMISGEKKKYTDESMLENILVARGKISAGTTIEANMVTSQRFHKSLVSRDAIRAGELNQVLGSAPNTDIQPGEALLSTYFMEGGAMGIGSRFLSGAITTGERAITVRVDEESGVAGLIRPGDYLDIIGTFDKPGTNPQRVTLTLLQAVPVLAVGSQVGLSRQKERTGIRYATITLAVTPEEAELIEFSRRKTKLVFVMRGAEDLETDEQIPQVDFTRIFGKEGLTSIQKKRNAMNKKRIEVIK